MEDMKNEFINKLDEDENLILHSVAEVSKTSNQIWRFLLACAVMLLFWTLNIFIIKSGEMSKFDISVMSLILGVFTIFIMYGFVYNMFFKYRNKNNEYFVTNKRIAVYNPRKGFRMEKISDIVHIGISREKNDYGNISFNFYTDNVIEMFMNGMEFEGIENPRRVVTLICDINKGIHVYDDRPTIMGRKI